MLGIFKSLAFIVVRELSISLQKRVSWLHLDQVRQSSVPPWQDLLRLCQFLVSLALWVRLDHILVGGKAVVALVLEHIRDRDM